MDARELAKQSQQRASEHFENARRLVLARFAPRGCPELEDAVLGPTPNPVSELVIGWPGTEKETPLFHCYGRLTGIGCMGCRFLTNRDDPTRWIPIPIKR